MLTTRIIPCLDIKDGRIVKGVKFQGLRDAGDPLERAALYEQQGADELVMLDISATTEGRAAALHTIQAIRSALSIPLTVGGGVRSIADAESLLAAGADKVAVNTAAVRRPEILREFAERVGTQCVVLAIDAAERLGPPVAGMSRWEVVTHSGSERTEIDAIAWASEGERLGAGEILLTSFDRDGVGTGYDLALIGGVAGRVSIPIIASGGGSTAEHMRAAISAGANAVLAASIFHDGVTTVQTVKGALGGLGVEVRT